MTGETDRSELVSGFAGFLRELALIAPLIGQGGAAVIANAAAAILDAGVNFHGRLSALTAEMKARKEAGITTTAEEILADVERIQALDAEIQATKPADPASPST